MPTRRATSTRSQADRRAQSREALLRAAAQGLSRYGYGNLVLEQVAEEAGYTRGALYHQFKDKEELARAVVGWASETWQKEVGQAADREADPADALLALARGHAVLCRQDIARVAMALRVEFSGRQHPIGDAVEQEFEGLVTRLARLIAAGRRRGSIPPGPPPKILARALAGAMEGVVIEMAGQAPHDARMAERVARGLLGLPVAAA
jgi:AcrR family transcriptional regulator